MSQRNRTHEGRIQALEQWRDGNGARGVEERLQEVEETMITEARAQELIGRASKDTAQHVMNQLADKGHHKYRDIVVGIAAIGGIGGFMTGLISLLNYF
jgi:hypothetical protein